MDHVHSYGLVFNPLLIAKSKEVINIIKDIAYEHDFVCSDLILAVLWHSLDSSRTKTETQEKDDSVKYVGSKIVESKDLLDKQPRKSSRVQTIEADTFKQSKKISSTHSSLTENVISKEGTTSPVLTESVSSNKKTSIDIKHGKDTNPESSKEYIEVIDIDDDIEIVSAEESPSHNTKTILAENDECSYFEMDCEEIDENDGGDEEADTSSGVNVLCEVNSGDDHDKTDVWCEMVDKQITLDSIGIRRKEPCGKANEVSTQKIDVLTQHSGQSAISSSSMSRCVPSVSVVSNKCGTDTQTYSSLSDLGQSVSVESDSSPCKKRKRLLDHDKKWHMAPKHSVDQDKYLALPGGIESNSMNTDDEGDEDSVTSPRHSLSPPSVPIELVNADVENYNKDDLFKDLPTNIDAEHNTEAHGINQGEVEEKCERRKVSKDRNKQKGFNFSDVKKPVALRCSKRKNKRSQFLQVAKIGCKGFARKKEESSYSKAHDQSNLRSGKTKFGLSGRLNKYPLAKQTKGKTPKSVNRDLAQKSSKGKKKYSKKYGGFCKTLKSNSNKKSPPEKNLKSNGNLSDSQDETSSDEEDGFVEEVEWTTNVDENKFSEVEKKVGIKKKSQKRNSAKRGKSDKQKESKTVEVLLMDVDDVKLLDDVTSAIDNEHGETSRTERNADVNETYDSDVIIID